MKVKVHTILNVNNQLKEFEGLGILANNSLQYIENGVKVVLNFIEHKLIREDKEKKISYKFLEKEETENELLLVQYNLRCPISIYTKLFLLNDGLCHIKYKLLLEDEEVDYQIYWEEVE